MARITDAAEKQYSPDHPVENTLGIIFGKHGTSAFLQDVEGGALLDQNRPRQLRKAAAAESDEKKKESLLETAQLMEAEIARLNTIYGTEGARAIMAADAGFFREIADLIDAIGSGAGLVNDQARHRLTASYNEISASLRRPPTKSELKESHDRFQRMDHGQFARTCKQLGMRFSSAKLIQGIELRAETLRRSHRLVQIEALRDALRDLPSATPIVKLPDNEFREVCESAGVRFDDSASAEKDL